MLLAFTVSLSIVFFGLETASGNGFFADNCAYQQFPTLKLNSLPAAGNKLLSFFNRLQFATEVSNKRLFALQAKSSILF